MGDPRLFDIDFLHISETLWFEDKQDPHHEYRIEVETSFGNWSVLRRFREFYSLNTSLVTEFPEQIPQELFPYKKRIIRYFNADDTFVEQRRTKLEWYLRQLLFQPSLRSSTTLREFFDIETHATIRLQKFHQHWKEFSTIRKLQKLVICYSNLNDDEDVNRCIKLSNTIREFIQKQEIIFAQCSILNEDIVEIIENEKILDEITFNALFSSFCKISRIQQSIMDSLNAFRQAPGANPLVGHIFAPLCGDLEFYRAQHNTVQQLKHVYAQALNSIPKFKEFIESDEIQFSIGDSSVIEMLTEVMSFGREYGVYLKEILSLLPEDHMDYIPLSIAVEKL